MNYDRCLNLRFDGIVLESEAVPFDRQVLVPVKFIPDLLDLLSVSGSLNLVVMDVDGHFLVITVVVGSELSMTGFQLGHTLLMVHGLTTEHLEHFLFVSLESSELSGQLHQLYELLVNSN
jgi:hypothetical protein